MATDKSVSDNTSSDVKTPADQSASDAEASSDPQTSTLDEASESAEAGSSSSGETSESSVSSESSPTQDTEDSGDADEGSDSQDNSSTTDDGPQRIVVMGDLHADMDAAREAFMFAGATDASDQWVGGHLIIVQLGDLIGRSDDEREILDFIFGLQVQARAAGGAVHALIGNHEVMAGRLDNQGVGKAPFAAFEGIVGLDLDDPRVQKLPVQQRARGAALMPGGPYAKKIADLPTVLQLGRSVFVHGGVLPRWAEYGLDAINHEVSEWLRGNGPEPDCAKGVDNGDRVMWSRHFSSGVGDDDCRNLESSLEILGATRMIVAHTVHDSIQSHCNDRLWAIDVGMSRYYGGDIELLEIIDDQVSVIAP